VDGGYFGGYVKPANPKESRLDRRFAGFDPGTDMMGNRLNFRF
jgi:hypothetical protein